jgi:predicted permease
VRLSLGAGRGRIVRQLLTEGLLIAALAGAAALALASWLMRAATVALFSTLPPSLAALLRVAPMPLDIRVFAFALLVALVTSVAFALVPALQASRQPLTDALRGQRSGTRGASRLRSALVVAQVAASVLLVVAALVLARNFTSIGAIDLGYSTAGVYSVNVRGDDNDHLIAAAARALSSDPRVAEVAVTNGNPMFVTHTVSAGPDGERAPIPVRYTFVSPEFFSVLQIPVVRGRGFLPDESRSSARVAIVSEATARAFWPGADPIGQTLRFARPASDRIDEIEGYTHATVIGIVRDVVSGMMVEGPDRGHLYLPAVASDRHAVALLIRPRGTTGFGPNVARQIFRRFGLDPDTFEVIPLAELRDVQMYPLRAAAWIGGLLGTIALVLSITGLYGVLSYILSQRTREIGIRMALGASARAVVELMVRQSLRLAGVGAIVGLVLAAAAMKALSSVVTLDAVSLLDTAPFAIGLAIALGATAFAAYYPSRRATRIDPAETLRAEG